MENKYLKNILDFLDTSKRHLSTRFLYASAGALSFLYGFMVVRGIWSTLKISLIHRKLTLEKLPQSGPMHWFIDVMINLGIGGHKWWDWIESLFNTHYIFIDLFFTICIFIILKQQKFIIEKSGFHVDQFIEHPDTLVAILILCLFIGSQKIWCYICFIAYWCESAFMWLRKYHGNKWDILFGLFAVPLCCVLLWLYPPLLITELLMPDSLKKDAWWRRAASPNHTIK